MPEVDALKAFMVLLVGSALAAGLLYLFDKAYAQFNLASSTKVTTP